MTELTEREARELAGSLRPRRRPLLIAVTANAAIAILLLGVPYLRGHMLATEKRADFVSFVQCMIGGSPSEQPGLSLPRAEREHYAAKVLFANSDWPLSCRSALKRLEPPDAIFLWPSLKVAGADLRETIELMDHELVALAKRRTEAPGRVPQRPLDAMKRVQAATVLFARAADSAGDIDTDSVVLSPRVAGLAAPARLPLMIGETEGMLPWSEAGELELLAFDSHSLAYVHVDDGKLDRQRVRRNAFMRGVTRAGDTPYLVWAMPEIRCEEREDRCCRRPTGLSRYDKSSSAMEEPSWKLPGHPAERLDRGLVISETGRIDFLRRSSARGGVEWIRTRLPDALSAAPVDQRPEMLPADAVWTIVELPDSPAAPAAKSTAADREDAKPPPAGSTTTPEPDTSTAVASAGDPSSASPSRDEDRAEPKAEQTQAPPPMVPTSAVLLGGEPAMVLHATETGSGVVASLTIASQPAKTLALESTRGQHPWAVACTSGVQRWLAYGSNEELQLARFTPEQGLSLLGAQPVALGRPLDPDDNGADRLRLLCEDGRAQLLFVGRDRTLRQIVCSHDSCRQARDLVQNVAEFSAVLRRGLGLIAFQQGPLSPTIKLLRLDEQLAPTASPTVAGTCWEPLGGMCGRPTLIADAQRTVLLTRDGPDVLALETTNDGRTFAALSGLAAGHLLDSSTTSPLQQHRRRKGID